MKSQKGKSLPLMTVALLCILLFASGCGSLGWTYTAGEGWSLSDVSSDDGWDDGLSESRKRNNSKHASDQGITATKH